MRWALRANREEMSTSSLPDLSKSGLLCIEQWYQCSRAPSVKGASLSVQCACRTVSRQLSTTFQRQSSNTSWQVVMLQRVSLAQGHGDVSSRKEASGLGDLCPQIS